MITYASCPICNDTAIEFSFNAKDNTVSGESFEVWACKNCQALFTQHIPDEIAIGRYYTSQEYISHSDTKSGVINRLYHIVKNITLSRKRSLVKKETGIEAGNVLDIGSGTGAFLSVMKKGGWQVTGIEPDDGAREKAMTLYGLQVAHPPSLFSLPVKNYDAITLWHVLEHVHDLHKYLDTVKSLLKDNGKLFIAVPNHTSKDASVYRQHWAAYDVPRHLYHFSPCSMNVLATKHGMKIKRILPMWFDSFYISMLSEKYKNGNGNIPAALYHGASSNIKAMQNATACSSLIYILSKN